MRSATTPPGWPLGGEFSVNTTVAGNQDTPDVAVNDSGDFVVVWQGPDASNDGVYAQVFRADGSRLGREVAVNTTTQGNQAAPSVGMSASGRYAVAWTGDAQDGNNTTGIASQWMQQGDEVALAAGNGVNDGMVTLVGTLADINAMLDGIRFTPTAGFNGVASIRVDVDDLGHTGTGGSLTAAAASTSSSARRRSSTSTPTTARAPWVPAMPAASLPASVRCR